MQFPMATVKKNALYTNCKSCYYIIYLLCPRPPRDFLFYFEFFFSFGRQAEARGNGSADRGRRRRLTSRMISSFTFGSRLFLNFFFEFNLLFESFSFFIFLSRRGHNPFIKSLGVQVSPVIITTHPHIFCCTFEQFPVDLDAESVKSLFWDNFTKNNSY
jgi:hypothetical protein